jgi:hypothetical protein
MSVTRVSNVNITSSTKGRNSSLLGVKKAHKTARTAIITINVIVKVLGAFSSLLIIPYLCMLENANIAL